MDLNYKVKAAANMILLKAIKEGIVVRPKACSECGASGVPIQGHHYDYTKPIDVNWLCITCHHNRHRGSHKKNREDQASLTGYKLLTCKDLSELYGIKQSAIREAASSGRLRCIRIGSTIRFDSRDLPESL